VSAAEHSRAWSVVRNALEMVRDADEDSRRDGLPVMPTAARASIDEALAALPALLPRQELTT